MQDKCIGDFSHMKLIKTNQLVALGHAFAKLVQWICRSCQVPQLTMYFTHELMKMQPGFALDRNSVIKAVHQEAFAAPYPTEHVHTARGVGVVNQLLKGIGALNFVGCPVVGTAFQRINRKKLSWVRGVASDQQFCPIGLIDTQNAAFCLLYYQELLTHVFIRLDSNLILKNGLKSIKSAYWRIKNLKCACQPPAPPLWWLRSVMGGHGRCAQYLHCWL